MNDSIRSDPLPPASEATAGPAAEPGPALRININATATDWGWPGLILGVVLLIVLTQLLVHVPPLQMHNNVRRMFAGFVGGLLLLIATAGSLGLGIFGLMTALRTKNALPLCLAATVVSAVDLFFWILCAAAFFRFLD